MAYTFLISTTAEVTLNDLGGRIIADATVNLDLAQEYSLEEIRDSSDLRDLVVAGTVTASYDGQSITSGATFDNALKDFAKKNIDTNASNIATNAGNIATNTSDIATNAGNIATNTSDIATNTSDISQNASDISTLEGQVSALQRGGRRWSKAIDIVSPISAPPTEVEGARYVLDFTAGTVHASWDGASKGDIVTFVGTAWIHDTPIEGDVIWLDTPNSEWGFIETPTPVWEERTGIYEQTATEVPFSPTTSTDWNATPTQVGGALDEIAGRVETIENTAVKRSWSHEVGRGGTLVGDRDLEKAGSVDTNLSPYINIISSKLWGISVKAKDGQSYSFSVQVLVNGSAVHTATVTTSDGTYTSALNISVSAGAEVRYRYVKGASATISDLSVQAFYKEA
jgi:hypothetical protein